ncbi:folliculin [Bacillus rossius redtenbacheri]|uniref:folliculin n=1 Tax=Bacillus rossius redtenbacheri TaxID=93214 RepID=UPI002FDDCCC4
MNAVIGLCHFCELHGPSVLFCTQSFHDIEILSSFDLVPKKNFYGDETFLNTNSEQFDNTKPVCETCDSFCCHLRGFISNDHKNRISFVSAKQAVQGDVAFLLRQACFRSLSCEVTPAKEGAVFFGDDRGYVLSHTFSLKDAEARGFKRWFSIIMVMKDKYFLLSCWPFLVRNMRDMISELQRIASEVYDEEQSACPQRAMRLSSVPLAEKKPVSKFLRSFQDLTGDPAVFARLHLWFTWLLKAGGVYLMEEISIGLLPRKDLIFEVEDRHDTEGFAVVSPASPSPPESDTENSLSCNSDKPLLAIRNVRQLHSVLGAHHFLCAAYCAMVGCQVVVKGHSQDLVASVVKCLKLLLPRTCQRTIVYSNKYVPRKHCNLLGLAPETPVPGDDTEVFLLNITYHHAADTDGFSNFCCDICWAGNLPAKCPTILMKMEKAITNYNLHESVLEYYFFALKEEWLNIAKVLRKVQKNNESSSDLSDLLSSLGAKPQDKALLDFWAAGVL